MSTSAMIRFMVPILIARLALVLEVQADALLDFDAARQSIDLELIEDHMNFGNIQAALTILGHPSGANPNGNCTRCAILSARAMVNGPPPAGQAPGQYMDVDAAVADDGANLVMKILPDVGALGGYVNPGRQLIANRQNVVWNWLQNTRPGVFLFEQSADHVYNFVKHGGQIGLIDAATRTSTLVAAPHHCNIPSIPYPAGPPGVPGGYNYLNPAVDMGEPGEARCDNLTIYRWGNLHAVWH